MSEHGATAAEGPERPIYLDYQATTPCDPRVVEAMLPFFTERFGNPHSVHHGYGGRAEAAVETARAQVAALIGAEPRDIVFTSGATEANNLAIKGVARFHRERKPHVVSCATEHKCVLEACATLEWEGFAVTTLPVSDGGLIDLDQLGEAVTDNTSLVSIMAVNNEIGVIQPLAEIGALCRERGAFFHTDAAQALAALEVPLTFVQAITNVTDSPALIVLMMLGVFIVAGCVMETTPNIVILAPIMLPLAQEIGMNEIHFSIFMVTALGVGFITPPLGLNLFVLSGLTGESVLAIARQAVPFVGSMLVVVLLLAFVPALSTWAL